jgi:hypothetical protein
MYKNLKSQITQGLKSDMEAETRLKMEQVNKKIEDLERA